MPEIFGVFQTSEKVLLTQRTHLVHNCLFTIVRDKITLFTADLISRQIRFFFFLNIFLISFLEGFFKTKILFNIKKGSNRFLWKQVSSVKFKVRYFRRYLKVGKHIIGILFYSFLLKDASIFVNFFKKILEKTTINQHKKILSGLKKLIKDFFVPRFNYIGLLGFFFNIKGKIGVGGNSKKRRHFFYFGRHSTATKKIKTNHKFSCV